MSKTARRILIAAFVILLIAIGLERLQGPLSGNWAIVSLASSLLLVGFFWDGFIRDLRG